MISEFLKKFSDANINISWNAIILGSNFPDSFDNAFTLKVMVPISFILFLSWSLLNKKSQTNKANNN